MASSQAKVAHVDDYDSDGSCVKPGTRKEAKRKTSTSRPPKPLSRYHYGTRDGASDSGYSSHTSGTQASNTSANAQQVAPMAPPPRPSTSQGKTKPKPVVHRRESLHVRPHAPVRTDSATGQTRQCEDPKCRDPRCPTGQKALRRRSLPQQYAHYAPQYGTQYAVSPSQYQRPVPQYQYQYVYPSQAQTTQAVPTPNAHLQPRQVHNSRRDRPVSIHGYAYPSSYNGAQPGPPPANSAYPNLFAAWAQYYQQQGMRPPLSYGTTPPNQRSPMYPQTSPITTSPTSPNFSASGLQRTYSARVPASGATAYEYPKVQQHAHSLTRTISARQASARTSSMPGAFPVGSPHSSEADSGSVDSSSEEEYERNRRARTRSSQVYASASSSERRPSIKRQYVTAPAVPTTSSRNARSDAILDYISSSDNVDSDRTARAVVDRPRTTYTSSSRSSRRPSISTTASSGRTKATTLSSATSGMANLVLEGKNGRNIAYLSKRDQDTLARRAAQQQLDERQDQIEAYQDAVRGGRSPEVTADNIRTQQLRRGSRASSSSKAQQNADGIKIESNGTVIHVYGDSKIEMRAGEDGGPAQFVIGSASGRDGAYQGGSKSSGSSRRKGGSLRREERPAV